MQQEIWVTHETIYDFDRSIDSATVRARLRPIDNYAQRVLESEVHCHPRPVERTRTVDVNGGAIDRFVVPGPLRRIELRGQSRLAWMPHATGPATGHATEPAPRADRPDSVPSWARPDGTIWQWARRALPDRDPGPSDIAAFMDMLRTEFAFDPTATQGNTRTPAFFAARRGVCQDYAALAAGCLRARGVPVRLVFGYLIRDPAGGHRFEEGQPHAWLSTWSAGTGWRDADPTTGLFPPANHITLRRGRRLRDVQPVAGRLLAPAVGQQLTVRVTVVKDAGPS